MQYRCAGKIVELLAIGLRVWGLDLAPPKLTWLGVRTHAKRVLFIPHHTGIKFVDRLLHVVGVNF